MLISCEVGLVSKPWNIFVNRRGGIRIIDVFEQIYESFSIVLNDDEKKKLNPHRMKYYDRALRRRCAITPGLALLEERKGMRRVDLLEGHTIFMGLELSAGRDYWLLRLGNSPTLVPTTRDLSYSSDESNDGLSTIPAADIDTPVSDVADAGILFNVAGPNVIVSSGADTNITDTNVTVPSVADTNTTALGIADTKKVIPDITDTDVVVSNVVDTNTTASERNADTRAIHSAAVESREGTDDKDQLVSISIYQWLTLTGAQIETRSEISTLTQSSGILQHPGRSNSQTHEISPSPSPTFDIPSDGIRPSPKPLPDWSGALDHSIGALTFDVGIPDRNLQPGNSMLDVVTPSLEHRLTNSSHYPGRRGIYTNWSPKTSYTR